jgi:hypothetical protein
MPAEFKKCKDCGMIFPDAGGQQELCPKCRHEDNAGEKSTRDLLRTLKNLLRDAQSQGQFLTVPELAKRSGIEEGVIWHFIQTDEIETAAFNDPEVRGFVARRQMDKLKATQQRALQEHKPAKPEAPREHKSGFHLKVDDDRDK